VFMVFIVIKKLIIMIKLLIKQLIAYSFKLYMGGCILFHQVLNNHSER